MLRFVGFIALFFVSMPLFAQQSVKEAVQPYVDRGCFPGLVVAKVDGEGNRTCVEVGWADREKKIPMSENNIFWIASMTKGITGAALMILVDEGKIDLDAPVETYLPEFMDVKVATTGGDGIITLHPPKNKPTVRQVMSHTSGWPFGTPQMRQFGIDVFPPRKLASTAVLVPLTSEPGTYFAYSNLGIDIGSAIIEVVSGTPFDEFLRKRLFEPLEMTETDFWLTEEQESRLARTYRIEGDSCLQEPVPQLHHPLTDRKERFPEAGGGLFSTPTDILKFYQMLAGRGVYRGKRILSDEAIQTLATKQTPEGVSEGYSFGFWVNGPEISHAGALQTLGIANTKTGEARVYMVQLTSEPDPEIQKKVMKILDQR